MPDGHDQHGSSQPARGAGGRVAVLPTPEEIAAEWRRRAGLDGLARVMRVSQPASLAAAVTEETRRVVADHLQAVAGRLARPVRSALEVGCGIGRITPTIAAHAGYVLALDPVTEMLRAATRACAGLPNVEFHRHTAQRLPHWPARFDVAVCVWVLMHILDEEEVRVACRRVAGSARHLVLVEYEHADVPVGAFSRLRSLEDYLAMLPGARLLGRQDLYYGGDRSFAALIALDPEAGR